MNIRKSVNHKTIHAATSAKEGMCAGVHPSFTGYIEPKSGESTLA